MSRRIEAFVVSATKALGLSGPVYQFGYWPTGQWQMEASLRRCFPATGLVGCELNPEARITRLPFPDGAARTILCSAAIERSFASQRAAAELQRILAPGGALLAYALPMTLHEKASSSARWYPTPGSIERLLSGIETTIVAWEGANAPGGAAYGIGIKAPSITGSFDGTNRFVDLFPAQLGKAAGWSDRLKRLALALIPRRLRRERHPADRDVQFAIHCSVQRYPLSAPHFKIGSPTQSGSRLDLME